MGSILLVMASASECSARSHIDILLVYINEWCCVNNFSLGRVGPVVSSLHQEGVCLATLHIYLGYQLVVNVPRDAPRRMT